MKLLTLIICVFFSTTVLCQNAVRLNKGESSPFTGTLLTDEILQEIDKDSRKVEILEKQVITLKDLNLIKDSKVSYYKDEVGFYHKEIKRERRKSFWSNVGYFTLGCLLTGLAAKVAIESTRR